MSTGDDTGGSQASGQVSLDRLRALFEIREARRSGVLSVVADEVTTTVTFDRGEPIDAVEAGIAGEPLGRLLVRTRVLTPSQNAKVIDAMATALGGEKEQKFGEIAIAQGVLTRERLDAALSEQVRWRIVRALQREGATWSFADDAAAVAAATRRELSLEAIVLDAARWYRIEQRRAAIGEAASSYVTLRPDTREVAQRFAMSEDEQVALEAFDGTATAGDLVGIEPAAAGADVSALLVALLAAGALERSDMPRPGSGITELSLAHGASAGGAKASRHASRPPSQFPKPNERTTRTLARLRRLRAAETPTTRPEDRKPQNEREARVLAEQWFQHGQAHLRANRLAEAVPLLRRAFGLMPKNLEFELYAMWVEVRVHGGAPNPTQLASLRNIAVAAIRQDPNFAFAYYVLGQVTLLEGSESLAKHHFAHAMRLDPDAIDAERHVRILKRRESRSRVPQVRRSRPPLAAPSGTALARVSLKKASLDSIAKPMIPSSPSIPSGVAAALAEGEGDRISVALYDKPQKTLEMPAELPGETKRHAIAPAATPSPAPSASIESVKADAEPPKAAAADPPPRAPSVKPPPPKPKPAPEIEELELEPDPESGLTKTASDKGATSTVKSPLPDGPSSLTAVARVADGEGRMTPTPKPAPSPPKQVNRSGLYVGGIMMMGVFVAAFAMLGLRGTASKTVDPKVVRPSTSVSTVTATGVPAPSPSTSTSTAMPASTPPSIPPSTAMPSTSSSAATPMPSTSVATPTPTPTPSASAAPAPSAAAAVPAATGAREGAVVLPAWASQRRVYVDGKLVGNGVPRLVVACGTREVKIGSSGTPKTLKVPCDGTVEW